MQILKIINVPGSNIYAILIGVLWEADTKKVWMCKDLTSGHALGGEIGRDLREAGRMPCLNAEVTLSEGEREEVLLTVSQTGCAV